MSGLFVSQCLRTLEGKGSQHRLSWVFYRASEELCHVWKCELPPDPRLIPAAVLQSQSPSPPWRL